MSNGYEQILGREFGDINIYDNIVRNAMHGELQRGLRKAQERGSWH
jgi:hypothetical protein